MGCAVLGVNSNAKPVFGLFVLIIISRMKVSEQICRLPLTHGGWKRHTLRVPQHPDPDSNFVGFGQPAKAEMNLRGARDAINVNGGSVARWKQFRVRQIEVRENLRKAVDVIGVVAEQVAINWAIARRLRRRSASSC